MRNTSNPLWLIFLSMVALVQPVNANIAPAVTNKMTSIEPGKSAFIRAHGVCREVANNNPNAAMIPHRTAEEWSVGDKSFLAAERQGFNVKACPNLAPTEDCFFWVSGFSMAVQVSYDREIRHIGSDLMKGSNTVGMGDYPDSYGSAAMPGPFMSAANNTFDSIALGYNTRIVVYEGKNYTGQILADITGPKFITNAWFAHRDSGRMLDPAKTYLNADWSSFGTLYNQFPPSTRGFLGQIGGTFNGTGTPMYEWEDGSVRVMCN